MKSVSANTAVVGVLLLASCSHLPHRSQTANVTVATPAATTIATTAQAATTIPNEGTSSATIIPGQPAKISKRSQETSVVNLKNGDVSLNFPAADVQVVAKAVFGDILKVPYAVTPGLTTLVTVVTPHGIARTSVLTFVENAFRTSNIAIIFRDGVYTITPVDQAKTIAQPVREDATGFGSETIKLEFVNAEEMRKLLEPVLPGVVTRADTAQNILTIAGTTGQRANVRDLLKQFDVNWLRTMSFALYVPKRTDARLLVPELDKLINSDGAPTKGLVKLIAMERLNGVLAVSAQRQYLDDVARWVEVLDREGQNNEARLFVYKVQNSRAADLAKVINNAFSGGGSTFGDRTNSTSAQRTRPSSPVGLAPPTNLAGQNGNVPPATTGRQEDDTSGSALNSKITADETNNAILVYGTPRDYAIIEDALRKLDILPYQVLIEAAITEVTLTDALRYGVNWSFAKGSTSTTLRDTALPSTSDSSGTSTTSTDATSATLTPLLRTFPGFSFFYSNANSISATLNALESLTKVNVVSAPKLVVLNNQTASLQVGNQVPVSTGSATSTIGANAPIVNSIEYRDTGVILKITPRVNSSGLVLLDVAQEVSQVSSQASAGGISSPTISTRKIASTVAVQDGQTIALGGLITDNRTDGRSGVPILSRIPYLGALFGNKTGNGDRTELLVLIKPRVIRSIDDGRAVTDELRQKIQSIDHLPGYGPLP